MPRKAQPAFLRRWPGTARWPLPGLARQPRSTEASQRIQPSASFGSSVTLDFTEILQDALENFPFFRYDRDNTMERWGKRRNGKTIVPAVFPSAKSRDLCVAFCTDHGASMRRRRAPRPVGKLEKAALLLVPNLKQGVLLCCMPL